MSIQFLDNGSLGQCSLFDRYTAEPSLALPPGGRFAFPGWEDLVFTDTVSGGNITRRRRSHTGISTSGWAEYGPITPDCYDRTETIDASVKVRAQTTTVKEIDLLIKSRKLQFVIGTSDKAPEAPR
jgi:hypothetical protein